MIAAMRVSLPMAEFVTWVGVSFAIGLVVGAIVARRR